MKVGDWVYREDRFVSTLSIQGISWGMHRVTLKAQSGTGSQIWPFGQDSFIRRVDEEAARSRGIEPQQHQLLLAVKGLPQGTRPTVTPIARQLCVRHNSAVELVNRLVDQGALRRRHGDGDHSEVLVELTPYGEALLYRLSVLHWRELHVSGPALPNPFAPSCTTLAGTAGGGHEPSFG